jgi:hypothetical protein
MFKFPAFPVIEGAPELSLVSEEPFSVDTAQFACTFKPAKTSDPAKTVEYRVEWFVGGVSFLNDTLSQADGANSSLLRVDSLSSEEIRKSVSFEQIFIWMHLIFTSICQARSQRGCDGCERTSP